MAIPTLKRMICPKLPELFIAEVIARNENAGGTKSGKRHESTNAHTTIVMRGMKMKTSQMHKKIIDALRYAF